ncbi:hypothetical protein ACA910_002433 [Epithemia clementina (nom. ined.)]
MITRFGLLLLPGASSFNLLTAYRPVDSWSLKESLSERGSTSLDSSVAIDDEAQSASHAPSLLPQKRTRLPRPQRKALERARKANRGEGNPVNQKRDPKRSGLGDMEAAEGEIRLRSSGSVAVLNQESTFSDVLAAIKKSQNNQDNHDLNAVFRFLVELTDSTFADGKKGSLLSRLAVAALHLKNHRIAAGAINYRQSHFRDCLLPMESAALVRNLLRTNNVTEACNILETELSWQSTMMDAAIAASRTTTSSERSCCDLLKYRPEALSYIASWHFFEGQPRAAIHACRKLASMGEAVRAAGISGSSLGLPLSRLLQGAAKCQSLIRTEASTTVSLEDDALSEQQSQDEELARIRIPCNVVYSVLDVMMSLPSENDDRVYELLSNALVRRVVFITGAVNMDGCPPPDRGEAAFIGRSNVGKSSLVNMITNRKSLAYISKRPGKTQQFNFFAVNDKAGKEQEVKYGDIVDGEKDADSFYIVDLPGFGFAKVPDKQRQEWASFMKDYIATRTTLRVVFHLVDSRHGPTEEDLSIMNQVGENLPAYAKYVIVLTKADKNVKGARQNYTGKVSKDVMEKLRRAMAETSNLHVPVVVTSAETKLGRDEMWSYLRCAAAS